jgi:MoaA/NifB/PqqE/SkfB family radical SAM enzyme
MSTNKTFCAIPFMGPMVDTTRKIRACCMTNERVSGGIKIKDQPALAGETTLMDAWNSEHVIDMRKKMINNELVESCNGCYFQEQIGKTSNRQHSIIEWTDKLGKEKFDKIIETIIKNDFISTDTPTYLDLRLGNLCNLKCRMCNPWNSSQIAKEHFELFENNEKYKKLWIQIVGKNINIPEEETPWYESNFFWDEIISFIPNLKKVYLTGGEPTLIENNFRFMQEIINQGYAEQIVLFFNINCTNVNSRFLNLISQFKRVEINASVDGIGATNDYIRFPSKWKQIEKTLNQLAELNNVHLNITPTLTIYNTLECDNIILFAKELSLKHKRRIGVDYSFNRGNDALNSTLIDLKYRQPVINRLGDLLKDPWVNHVALTRNAVESLIGLLSSTYSGDTVKYIEIFKDFTEVLDESREQNFKETFPELYKIMYE